MPGWAEPRRAGSWPRFECKVVSLWKGVMQSPRVFRPKCLGYILDSSLAPKFVWWMVLKTNTCKVPAASFQFDGSKGGGKAVLQLWDAHRFGKVYADSVFRKEDMGWALLRASACYHCWGRADSLQVLWLQDCSCLKSPCCHGLFRCDFCLPFFVSLMK